MRITKWGEYGILCCIQLGKGDWRVPTGADKIASQQDIPLQYAQQILQRLRKGSIIESVRGPGGGYRLHLPAEEITLKDILYAAEGATFEVICETNSIFPDCSNQDAVRCGLHDIWYELKDCVDTFLGAKYLSDLIARDEALSQNQLVHINETQGDSKAETSGKGTSAPDTSEQEATGQDAIGKDNMEQENMAQENKVKVSQ